MFIQDERQILDPKIRMQIIEAITSEENVARKNAHLKSHECYKDKTKKWVIEALSKEFSLETVIQMKNRASNISILKKVVQKLAKAYLAGVKRTGESEGDTQAIEAMAESINLNTQMKKVDRMVHLHRNAILLVVPERLPDGKFNLSSKVVPPHLYDVVPRAENPELPLCLVLTDFVERNQGTPIRSLTADGVATSGLDLHDGDRNESVIAESADDRGSDNREFIFWTNSYHFTTNEKGEIIKGGGSEGGTDNPVKTIPAVFFSDDQDGSFWAEGGNDLTDGAILINVLATDLYAIANAQGWGQPVISGEFKEAEFKGGLHRALFLKAEGGTTVEPKFYYASSNPPLDQHMKMIEMATALYLSTNNLSPTNVAGRLDALSFPSGIAKMVEDAQSTEPVEEKQRYYKEKEPEIFDILSRWQMVLSENKSLAPRFQEIPTLTSTRVTTEFMQTKQIITEKEKLENLKLRKELGLSTLKDLVQRDNPDLSDEDAQARVDELKKEKAENTPEPLKAPAAPGFPPVDEKPADEEAKA